MKNTFKFLSLLMLVTVLISACGSAKANTSASAQSSGTGKLVEYSLMSTMADGQMAFVGMGGGIDGVRNPTLSANVGDTVKITLTGGDSVEHDLAFPDFNAQSEHISGKGSTSTFEFVADKPGSFTYNCLIAGHKEAGMLGKFEVTGTAPLNAAPAAAPASGNAMPMSAGPVVVNNPPATGADIVRDPTEIPAPIGDREPQKVRIDLETVEIVGQLADGTTYDFWTFNGKVPGPFFRVRVGDTVEVHLKNLANNKMAHSVDFHAVTGPGGGAVFSNTLPGEETVFTFKALIPGLFVYHCATPMVAEHISNGMYGMILVEPEGGLPPVDREFYVMQGEIYTNEAFGSTGQLTENVPALLNEDPEYFVLNGAVGGLTTQKPLKAKVGETVRIFFGVGGPNFTSSFHVIGEMFDRVYDQASLTSAPLTNVQTTMVPPGGATMVEFQLQVPGKYILVDHALARLQRGLAGYLIVDGPAAPEILDGTPMPGSGH
ncbi:MAG TPA: copper-containing nitrite reductase [Anaerolineales bacterium]|nr:copper-containing nitrite reductase [Anaerolineales bacterium]